VGCLDISKGQLLLQIALQCGLRESGIIATKKRITVAIRSIGLGLKVPLSSSQGIFYPGKEYLLSLVNEANRRFELNMIKLKKLFGDVNNVKHEEELKKEKEYTINHLPNVNLWGHCCCFVEDEDNNKRLVVIGGYGKGPDKYEVIESTSKNTSDGCSRCSYVFHLSKYNVKDAWETAWKQYSCDIFSPRVGHAACVLQYNSSPTIAVFGGRSSPLNPCPSDLYFYCYQSNSWWIPTVIGTCPSPRWGHSLIALQSSPQPHYVAALIRGRNSEEVFSSLFILEIQ